MTLDSFDHFMHRIFHQGQGYKVFKLTAGFLSTLFVSNVSQNIKGDGTPMFTMLIALYERS